MGIFGVPQHSHCILYCLAPITQSLYESPGQSGVAYFDEIRLGTTLIAVTAIPEPASLVSLGAATILLGARRRRRR